MDRFEYAQQVQHLGMWDALIHTIIRPPKITYEPESIGAELFTNKAGTRIRRIDREVYHQSEKLDVSLFIPVDETNPNYTPPNLILYCHCNASNKLECKQYVDYLPINYAIAGFDFLGCGNSKDMYISLGCRQSQQIRTLVNAFRPMFKRIIPWGRSMGASSVLMYGQAPIMIVDSPFTSLDRVGKDALYGPKSIVPACCVCCCFPCIYCCVRCSVKEKAHYDMNSIDNIRSVKRMSPQQAIIFIVGKDDDIILPSHSERLYKHFKGRKQILLVEGTHVTRRKRQVFDQVIQLLEQYIRENDMAMFAMPTFPTQQQLMPMPLPMPMTGSPFFYR